MFVSAVQKEVARGATEEQAIATVRLPQYEKNDRYDQQRGSAVRVLSTIDGQAALSCAPDAGCDWLALRGEFA